MVPEHTWGLDMKVHLHDYANYDAAAFQAARVQPNFKHMEESWAEQRTYLHDAVRALGPTAEGAEARKALARLEPAAPDMAGYAPMEDHARTIETAHFSIAIDARYGAISYLRERQTGRVWASATEMLALMQYETFSGVDYERFWRQYVVNKRTVADWARPDQTKPGLPAAAHVAWQPRLLAAFEHHDEQADRVLLELAMPPEASTRYGCPEKLTIEIVLPCAEPSIHLTVQWFRKPACRLPEAIWLSFIPRVSSSGGWQMEKMGHDISPRDVVTNGNRKLHAVGTGVSYRDARGGLSIEIAGRTARRAGSPVIARLQQQATGGA